MDYLNHFLNPVDVNPESKKDHELNTNDRMYLINKKIDENFLLEVYENLIKNKNLI